jgi:hypothetical protein
MPKFDYTTMKYQSDLARGKEFMATPVKEFIRRFRPHYAFEVTIGEIVGVPNIAAQVVGAEPHLEVRYFLFDQARKVH